METTSRSIEYVSLDNILGTDGNPKLHDLPTVIRSIAVLGFTSPAVLDERTDRLIIGNGRLEAVRAIRAYVDGEAPEKYADVFSSGQVVRALTDETGARHAPDGVQVAEDGTWLVPLVRGWQSRDDEHARAAVIADNKLTERGGWDDRLLTEWLDELLDTDADLLQVTGFTSEDVEDLLGTMGPPPSLDDLADKYGEPNDSDMWPVLRFKVPPNIRAEFYEVTQSAGEDDVERFTWLVNQARR